MRVLAAFCAATLLVACSPKPSDQDVRAVLAENVPQTLKAVSSIDQVQVETSASGDEAAVKFKATLKTSEALYVPVSFDEAAAGAGANAGIAAQVSAAAEQLSAETRAKFKGDVEKATAKPTFIKAVTPANSTSEWYGSYRTRKVVDKWIASDFKTDASPKFEGQPKAAFPADAIEVAAAKQWFAELQPRQEALLQRLADAKSLEQKDAELAEQQATAQRQIAEQQAAAQRERQAKEALIAAQEKQAKRLPLQVGFRPAAMGGTQVMRVQALQPMTLRVEVTRGLQHFGRDLQVAPGRVLELGHLEGWGFKTGDQVNLSNPSFDAASFVVR